MSNENHKASDAIKTKLPQLEGTVEEIPASDLDEVAGGLLAAGGEKCQGTCTDTKVSASAFR